jgi:hypothetical protein
VGTFVKLPVLLSDAQSSLRAQLHQRRVQSYEPAVLSARLAVRSELTAVLGRRVWKQSGWPATC